jgi:hypothetical protein
MKANTSSSLDAGSITTPSNKTTLHKKMLSLAIIQALACVSGALNASTITVDDETDASTASNCTLRDALEAANTDAVVGTCTAGSGADTINFNNALSGSTVTLGGSALDIDSDLTIDGDIDDDGTADITVSGNDASRVFVIDAITSNKTVTLEGLTIRNGDAPSTGPGSRDSGGGVFCQTGNNSNTCNLIVSNSTITNNVAAARGGGLGGRQDGYFNITLTNSTVSNNTANGGGGGIQSYKGDVTLTDSIISGNTTNGNGGGVFADEGEVTLTNSTISGNESKYGNGGGIFSADGNVTMTDSTVFTNTAYYGAGISTQNSNVSLYGSTISNNTSSYNGGAIQTSDGNIGLIESTISGNNAGSDGGGIHTFNGDVSLIDSTISGNDTARGGGGGIFSYSGGVSLTNSTISGNTAVVSGGGMYVKSYEGGGSVTLTNSTIVNNTITTGTGGGLYFEYAPSAFNMVNTILANNTGGDCETNNTFTPNTDTNNLETSSSGDCGIAPISTADPDLNALADNGGATLTHLPNVGSPVIDAGDNASCGAGLTITTDQRGAARDDGMCDIGAVEDTTPPPVASVQLDSTTATVSEDGSTITLNLTRSGDTVSAISVDYSTSDGTAMAATDYTAGMNTLDFATGITSQSVTIDITNDSDVEPDEDFTLTLSNVQLVSGSATVELGANAATIVTITDDDTATPVDDDDDKDDSSSSGRGGLLGLSPWWSVLMLTGWLRRRFGS